MPKDLYTLDDLRRWESATADAPIRPRLAVFGDPVAHSLSPQMHNPALAHCGIAASYVRLHIRAR
jgi:shikimate dehydrogenase